MDSGRFGNSKEEQGTGKPYVPENEEDKFWADLHAVLQEDADSDSWEALKAEIGMDTGKKEQPEKERDETVPSKDRTKKSAKTQKSRKKPEKKNRNPLVWLIPVGILAVAAGVLIWCMTQYVIVGMHFYPKNAAMLDLREEKLSVSQYEKIAEKLPKCEIYWNVPFQNGACPNDTEALTVTTLSGEDVLILDYLPKLKNVDARQCTDYENLAALRQRRPEVNVDYAVTLNGKEYPLTTRDVTLDQVNEEEIPRLVWLEELKTVTVEASSTPAGFKALQTFCHDHGLTFQVELCGKAVADNVKQVTIEDVTEEELGLLPLLGDMTQLKLINPQASLETVNSLEIAYPSVKIETEIRIGDLVISPDETDVDLSTVKVKSIEQVERAMTFLPKVKTLFMGEQDIPHDDMAAFRERVRDKYKVVWYVRFGDSKPFRTDITYFMPGRDCHLYNVTFTDATSYNIRYCEDLISVDVGHLGVKDVSWVAYLKNVEYLILAHTAVEHIDGIENCKKLKFLELDWSGIRTLDPLKGCTALEDLNIGNTFPDVSALKEMPWLKNIYMIFGSGKDAYELSQALPDTRVVTSGTATVASGWRNLPNYYAMRDALHAYYMN